MVFAALIIEQRRSLGKDPMLRIRDETITPADVQKYWKRKPYRPEDSPYFPGNSQGIQPSTPAVSPTSSIYPALPHPGASYPGLHCVDMDNEDLDFGESAIVGLGEDVPFPQASQTYTDTNLQYFCGDTLLCPSECGLDWHTQSQSVPPLWIPAVHSQQETFIFYANEYMRAGVEAYKNKDTVLVQTEDLSSRIIAQYLQGRIQFPRGKRELSMFEPDVPLQLENFISTALNSTYPLLLPHLLWGLVNPTKRRLDTSTEVRRPEMRDLLALIRSIPKSRTKPGAYLLIRILETLDVDNVSPFLNTVSDLMSAIFKATAVGDDTILAAHLYEALGEISTIDRSCRTALDYFSKAGAALIRATNTSRGLGFGIERNMLQVIGCLLQLDDLEEAEKVVKHGLCLFATDESRPERALMLKDLSRIRYKQGRVTEGDQVFDEALQVLQS